MIYKIAAIQMNSSNDLVANLQLAATLVAKTQDQQAKLVILPEDFAFRGEQLSDRIALAEDYGQGRIQEFLADLANQHGIYLVGGSIPIKGSESKRIYSSSLLFGPDGRCLARYNKIHLFDVTLPDRGQVYLESDTTIAGDEVVVVPTKIGNIGLSICYDLRFPELFRSLSKQSVDIIVLPAAFTVTTGIAHWEVLLRARAIENLAYVAASAQSGAQSGGRDTYGHSMIVDPWGIIGSVCVDTPGFCFAEVDLEKTRRLRQSFPVLTHTKMTY